MSRIIDVDEVDLLDLVQMIWDGKLTVILFVIAGVLTGAGAWFVMPKPTFVATTEIMPIKTENSERYRLFNQAVLLDFNDDNLIRVDADSLLKLFLEELEHRTVFEESIKKHNLLDRQDFESDDDYNDAVSAFAASINILPPANIDGTGRGERRPHWNLLAEYHDKEKWLDALQSIHTVTTNNVRNTIQEKFFNIAASADMQRKFAIEDLGTAIENAAKDYDRVTSDKLYFLREQAAIARALDIETPLAGQSFASLDNDFFDKEEGNTFFMRGYKAIEKEVELLISREDNTAFTIGLFELEKKKRELSQDKKVERAKSLLELTPVGSGENFIAVSIRPDSTVFKWKGRISLMLVLTLAFVMGGMIGVVYLVIANLMRGRRERDATAS